MRARGVVLALAAAGLTVVGCGGGSGPKSSAAGHASSSSAVAASNPSTGASAAPTGQVLTRGQYVAKANALCASAQRVTPKFPGTRSGSGLVTTTKLIVPYLNQISQITATTLDGLRALRPPSGQRPAADRLVATQQARLDDLRQALAAALKSDGTGFTAAIQKDQRHDAPAYARAASQLGLNVCAGRR